MKIRIVVFLLLCSIGKIYSQKNITLAQCEDVFLKNNLYLLANHYNIDISEAQVLQAKIWDQPQFGFEMNAWAPNEEQKIFNAGKDGEKAGYVQQLIHIGGQRKNQIDLAKSNAKLAAIDFEILLRDLKFQLRKSFFEIYFDSKSINEINLQLEHLNSLINAYSEQTNKGNIALKDLVRLQNLQLNLKTDRTDLANSLNENQKVINLLLANDQVDNFTMAPTTDELKNYDKELLSNITDLQSKALENRPDYKKEEARIEASNQNLKLQKSLSIPDLTVGASYDQRGGAFTNQTNLTIGIPLPLWNKNKGNIKAAKLELSQTEQQKNILSQEVKNDVKLAFAKYSEQKNNYLITKTQIPADLQTVYQGVYSNFLKRNISLLEFTDFLESYNNSVIALNKIVKSYITSCEEINYTTASKIF